MSKPAPDSFLPLPVSEFHILLSLADGERHGYAMMTEVAERTEGAVKLGPGTLYGAVKRMLDNGLIAERGPHARAGSSDERRRTYALTPLGRSVARAEAQRLDELVRHARRKRILGLRTT